MEKTASDINIPLKISNYFYKVCFVEDDDERLRNGDDYHVGLCQYVQQEILIANNLSYDRMKRTLIHELTHAFMEAYGFHSHRDDFSSDDICEFMAAYSEEILDSALSVMGRRKTWLARNG